MLRFQQYGEREGDGHHSRNVGIIAGMVSICSAQRHVNSGLGDLTRRKIPAKDQRRLSDGDGIYSRP